MRIHEPRIRVRIQTRGQTHDVTVAIAVYGLADEAFWRLIKAYKPAEPESILPALQETIQQEKQGVLGKTIGKECENNPPDKREVQERNQQGPDRTGITETGEAYDAEQALGDKEKAGKLSALGLRREFSRETGYYTPTEAGS